MIIITDSKGGVVLFEFINAFTGTIDIAKRVSQLTPQLPLSFLGPNAIQPNIHYAWHGATLANDRVIHCGLV